MNTVTTELVRKIESYSVVVDGAVRATAHCVFVPTRIYSVKVDGMYRGTLVEAEALEYLRTVDLDAPLDRSASRKLLGA